MRRRIAGSATCAATIASHSPLTSSTIALSLSAGSRVAARRRRASIRVGLPPRRGTPSASRRRRAGSTVMTAVRKWAVAAATPRAPAIVVLPTPPEPRTITTERGLSNSFMVAARSRGGADVTRQNSRRRRHNAPSQFGDVTNEAVDGAQGTIGPWRLAADTIVNAAPACGLGYRGGGRDGIAGGCDRGVGGGRNRRLACRRPPLGRQGARGRGADGRARAQLLRAEGPARK